jgi:hypothetical protein
VATAAATDFGVDVDARFGVPLRWALVSGRANLIDAMTRRFISSPGSLESDPNYGLDLRRFLNAGMTGAVRSQLSSRIAAQAKLDPRVNDVSDVVVTANPQAGSLVVTMMLVDAQGPFPLVLSIDALTVSVLNSGQPAQAATATTVVDVSAGAGAPGPAGPGGPSGPPGPAGTGGGGIELSFGELLGSNTGAEEIAAQLTVDMSVLAASTVTVDLAGRALSASGTATFRLYLGGTYDTIDGTLVGSATTASASFAQIQISAAIANPTGLRPVKVTIQSSGATIDAQLRDFTVSVK